MYGVFLRRHASPMDPAWDIGRTVCFWLVSNQVSKLQASLWGAHIDFVEPSHPRSLLQNHNTPESLNQ